ncbi:MAG TPA: cyclic nucleotide-binding domain-containing protein [Bacillota bacterium]|nr:cyclic nucleotide-binding domain-containing protein [Bacillota bacterium]
MSQQKTYILSKTELLSELDYEELSQLAEDFEWAEFVAGTDIVQQGQSQKCFFVLAEGSAESLVNYGGKDVAVKVTSFQAGDTFGYISFFTGEPSPASIRCLEDCKVLMTDADKFRNMLDRWPKLYQKFSEKLAHRIKQMNQGVWEVRQRELTRSGLMVNEFQQKFYGIWGGTKTTREMDKWLEELTATTAPYLVIGERGTGRQMVAWYTHKSTFGELAPFIVVDGRHFAEQLADTIQIAHGGTLFIKEINLLPEATQLKLVEAVSSGELGFRLVGSLKGEIDHLPQRWVPEFRQLFKQSVPLKPLRDRKRDIPPIAQAVLDKLAIQNQTKAPELNQEATKLLLSHNYRQGNVTELIQVMERAFHLAEADTIGLEHLFFGPTAQKIGQSINLLEWEWIEQMLKKGRVIPGLRHFGAALSLLVLGLLFFAPNSTAGLIAFPLVWGLGWPALAILSPSAGRVICAVCPVSQIMETVQKRWHLNLPVPDILKKYDYLFTALLFALVFFIETVSGLRSSPLYTAILFATIIGGAVITGIIFTRHTWCRHLCPLGNFMGMAAIGSSIEVRSDTAVCLNKCTTFDCYRGNGKIGGCPMSQHVPYLDNNLDCKLCFNCVRVCPNGAVQVNLRIPGREIWHMVRVNQGYVIFIGVALAILLPTIYVHSQPGIYTTDWRLKFGLIYWLTALAAGLVTWLTIRPFKTKAASRRVKLAFALVPLVLAGYIIFQIGFLPGVHSLMLGVGWQTAQGISKTFMLPALGTAQVLAAVIGLTLSSFAIAMVISYSNKTKA